MINLLKKVTASSAVLFSALASGHAHADAQFDLTLSGAIDGQPIPPKAQVLVKDNKVRIAFPGSPDYQEIIHDGSVGRFAIVDHTVQDVRYIDRNTVGDVANQAQQMAKQMGIELNVGALSDLLNQSQGAKSQSHIKATGEMATIATVQCEWHTFSTEGLLDRGCLAESAQLSFISQEDIAALNTMIESARAIGSQVSGILVNQPALSILSDLQINQLPLSWQGNSSGVNFEVRAMESKNLPNGITSIPQGYATSPLL